LLRPYAAAWLPGASRLVGACSVLVFAAPFVILLFYAVPALDDFCKASLTYDRIVQHNALTVTKLSYMTWSARWLSLWIQNSVLHHVNLVGAYGWLLLVVVLSNLAALWYFFRVFFRLTSARALLAAGGFYAAWLATISRPAEQFYWLTEAIEYTLPLSALLLLVSLLYRSYRGGWYYGAIAVLSFAIPAQHEVAGSFLCAILLIGVTAARTGRFPARPWLLSLAFAAPSQAIVMLAPGNAARAAHENQPFFDTAHLWHWIATASHDGLLWLAHPQILLLACCLLLLRPSGPLPDVLPAPRMSAWAGVAVMLAVFGESALIQVASGSVLADRVIGWLEFCLWLSLVCIAWEAAPKIRSSRWLPAANLAAWSLFAVSLFGSLNFRTAVADVRGPAQTYWRQNKARLAQRGGRLAPEGAQEYPQFALPLALSTDSSFWVNQCVANYLDASSVTVSNGNMVVNDTGWVRDVDHGWLYRFSKKTREGEVTYWDSGMKAFWWTSKKQYPSMFRFSDSSWLTYQRGSQNPRQFYNLTAKKWESWP
jgi:hypothetical protein